MGKREGSSKKGSKKKHVGSVAKAMKSAAADPKFAMPSSKKSRVKVDSRFKEMLEDPEYMVTSTDIPKTDKRGSLVDVQARRKRRLAELEKHYDVEDIRKLARGEMVLDGESSSDGGTSDDDYASEEEEEDENELEKVGQAEEVEHVEGKRLAVVGCDWDKTSAEDILVTMRSFTRGQVSSVEIKVSKFGQERLEFERRYGPDTAFHPNEAKSSSGSSSRIRRTEDEEGDAFDAEKLRKYEKERLLYYFAIVKCDSAETASKLYEECDGVEFMRSSVVLDLRIIPDPPKDWRTSSKPEALAERELRKLPRKEKTKRVSDDYKPPEFVNKALQHTKVDLTWDEPELSRNKLRSWGREEAGPEKYEHVGRRGEARVSERELERFLGSDDDDDDEQQHSDKRDMYASLLKELEEAKAAERVAESVVVEFSSDEEEELRAKNRKNLKKKNDTKQRRRERLERLDAEQVGSAAVNADDARFRMSADPDYHT